MSNQKTAFTIDADYVNEVLASAPYSKYFDLVSAARKPPLDADAEVWEEYWCHQDQPTPIDIRVQALVKLRQTAEDHAEEYASLKGENGCFEHGFNSGCLAMATWFMQAFDNESADFGGIEAADREFPMLET